MQASLQTSASWLPLPQAAQLSGLSPRQFHRHLQTVPANAVRGVPGTGRGRPQSLIHVSAHPRLAALQAQGQIHGEMPTSSPAKLPSSEGQARQRAGVGPSPAPTAADLTLGSLRQLAVLEYRHRQQSGASEAEAAWSTCRAWLEPQIRTVSLSDRLGHHRRDASQIVSCGRFAVSTLRKWSSLYIDRDPASLAPHRRGSGCGPRRKTIPQDLLKYVYSLGCLNSRAAVTRAVQEAKRTWPGEFPNVSIATWIRRLKELDPRWAGRDIMHSIRKFRSLHSPDISTDWSALPYNGEFQIDDIQQDWYAISGDLHLIRPYAYAVIRSRTRQWVAVLSSECPITKGQVRALVGFVMASPSGGIPDAFKFEHGSVSGDSRLFEILEQLGVQVHQTSMDNGKSIPQVLSDVGQGHPQGKPLVERAAQSTHNQSSFQPLQVGQDERNTAPVRHEKFAAALLAAHQRGEPVTIPVGPGIHAETRRAMAAYNDSPHSSHPLQALPNGEVRHQSPNECAAALAEQAIRLMPETYLPLFAEAGEVVKVTRNGILVNNHHYGKFDEALHKLPFATVFSCPEVPESVYIEELGRCLTAYSQTAPGDASQIPQKRAIEGHWRNQLEEAYATSIAAGRSTIIESTHIFPDPAAGERQRSQAEVPALNQRATRQRQAVSQHRERRASFNARFAPSPATLPSAEGCPKGGVGSPVPRSGRRGLLSRSEDLDCVLSAHGVSQTTQQGEPTCRTP